MSKFKFQINVGFLIRKQSKIELERSKEKLEYYYPGSLVTIREEKNWFDSTFFVQGTNFPDTEEFELQIKNWEKKLKSCEN